MYWVYNNYCYLIKNLKNIYTPKETTNLFMELFATICNITQDFKKFR